MEAAIPLKRAAATQDVDSKAPKRTRGRSGCLNCRRRRKKCDEAKPDCSRCRSRGEDCEWDTGITFRLSGLDAHHPSMLQSKTPEQSSSGFKIVDVRFQNKSPNSTTDPLKTQETRLLSGDPVSEFSNEQIDQAALAPLKPLCSPDESAETAPCATPKSPSPSPILEQSSAACTSNESTFAGSKPKCRPFPFAQANPIDVVIEERADKPVTQASFDCDAQMIDYPRSNSDGSTNPPSGPWSNEVSASSATSASTKSSKAYSVQYERHDFQEGLTNLDSLDYLVNRPSHTLSSDPAGPKDLEPDRLAQFRLKLYDNIRSTVNGLNHERSDSGLNDSANALQGLKMSEDSRSHGVRLLHAPLTARPLSCTKLLKRRQLELWRNYNDRVAPWLDVCGSKRYFQHSLPLMAKSADHLHYAVLALSARNIELRAPGSSFAESTGLYQDAVQLLSPELHTLEFSTVASCFILCVLEMMSSSSNSTSSLEACTAFIEAADINALSGGIKQALFWSLASVSLWSSASSNRPFTLPVNQFYPSNFLSTAVSYIRSLTWGEGYAKYAVFLASTIEGATADLDVHDQISRLKKSSIRAARWKALFELLEDWFNCRPEEMQPLMSYPSILDDYRNPFPMVLYSSAPATVGNQIYHASSILLLQNKPDEIKIEKPGKSLMWHARQICGIVAENQDHGSWVSGIKPLFVAGKVISSKGEHQAITDLYAKIERATGWRTSWYVESLNNCWRK